MSARVRALVAAWIAALGAPVAALHATPPAPAPSVAPRPRPRACPLRAGMTFTGTYVCAQGETDVTLRVLSVDGARTRAAFDFRWVSGGVAGSFTLAGVCDPARGRWSLAPEAWVRRPAGWIMVGMDGDLAPDASRYAGSMLHPSCGAFSVAR